MAAKIRLKRMGKIRAPYYRIVVADARTKRDGRVIEQIGKYHPKSDPSFIEVDSERAQYWLGVGAQPSDPVRAILRLTGDWQKHKGEPAPTSPLLVPEARRNKTDIFNEALQEAHKEPTTEAVTVRRSKKAAAAPPADKGASDPQAAEPVSAAAETPTTVADPVSPDSAVPADSAAPVDAAVAADSAAPVDAAVPADGVPDETTNGEG